MRQGAECSRGIYHGWQEEGSGLAGSSPKPLSVSPPVPNQLLVHPSGEPTSDTDASIIHRATERMIHSLTADL